MKPLSNIVIGAMLMLGVLGFADAAYLSANHFFGTPLVCTIFHGCDTVTTSVYSKIGPIPVALLGLVYYLTIILLLVAYVDTRNKLLPRIIALLTPLGLLASLWFVFVQLFLVKAICLYCMISATTSTTLFIFGMVVLCKEGRARKKSIQAPERDPNS